ncbi:hypothetical protein GOBAR_DD18349 [Gossypium barbadense]|nr:hypothetical protein GOBAR_DD18349 [Gossypium barbadense]
MWASQVTAAEAPGLLAHPHPLITRRDELAFARVNYGITTQGTTTTGKLEFGQEESRSENVLVRFSIIGQGLGVRAGEPILSGTFVCEYVGEILGEQKANNRLTRYGRDGCNYLFNIGSQINDMSRLIEGQGRYFIDASKYGNVSRFINHSCSPNLVNHQVLVDSIDCHRAHIGLYASQDDRRLPIAVILQVRQRKVPVERSGLPMS